ncbi:hypothetical protein ACSSS7_004710 [Eimeria intestinalis]
MQHTPAAAAVELLDQLQLHFRLQLKQHVVLLQEQLTAPSGTAAALCCLLTAVLMRERARETERGDRRGQQHP